MNGELLRLIDSISRDKAINKEIIFQGIEQALATAARKRTGEEEAPTIQIDRETGQIKAIRGGITLDPTILGRIAAQAAKQVIIQKIREAERDVVFTDFETRKGDIVHGNVLRLEGPHIVVSVGKVEAILLRGDQVPGETFRIGDRIRAYVYDVEKKGQKIRVCLTRASTEFVRRLFELEVPEITDKTVVIRIVSREPGYRTKVAVDSTNDRVDPVGACVGVRGCRIKAIVDELNGEKVDIIRWSDDSEAMVKNALKPAEIAHVELDRDTRHAQVYVLRDKLSLAIGKGGQNVRLASKMTGWEIDIVEVVEEKPGAAASDEGTAKKEAQGPDAEGDGASVEATATNAPAERAADGAPVSDEASPEPAKPSSENPTPDSPQPDSPAPDASGAPAGPTPDSP
jgi:N utilization substance protein A